METASFVGCLEEKGSNRVHVDRCLHLDQMNPQNEYHDIARRQ